MRKHELYISHHDCFEYDGSREIMRIRQRGGKVVRLDWIVFDSAEAALAFFNTKCGAFMGDYSKACRPRRMAASAAV